MKKLLTLCVPFFLLLLFLTLFGCASGGGSSSDTSTTTETTTDTDTTTDDTTTTSTTDPSVDVFINQLETACLSSGDTEVSAYVSVVDESGDLIDALDLSNFQIIQDSNEIDAGSILFATSDDLIPEPVSVSIIMDYSKSITELPDTQAAMEDAVTGFVDLMQLDDQAEIIKFNTGIRYLLPFTSNKTLLKAGVAYTEDIQGAYTYLYDTLYTGIEDVAEQSGRQAVVAITDGQEQHMDGVPGDRRTVEDIIALAQENEVPLFLIGLGENINEDELQEMAEETEGHFYQAASSDDLEDIYSKISDLLNIEQYLMIFEATANGEETGSLEITVNYNDLTDSAETTFSFAVCP
jgi:VWFA-related protein